MPRRNGNAAKRGMKRGGSKASRKKLGARKAPLTPLDLHPRKKTGAR